MQGLIDDIQQMSPSGIIIFTVGLGAFTLAMAALAYRKLRAYRIVADTPTARIRSAPQGYVELKGHFEPLDGRSPIRAPFSDKPCVWYRAWMEEERGSGDDKKWHTVFSEEDLRPCRLSDDTGDCLVLPAEANMRIKTVSETWNPGSWFGDPPAPLSNVDTGFFHNDVRFNEERIEIGRGYAIGRFTTADPGDGDAEEANAHVQQMIETMDEWRTDYMAGIEGRPDRHRPNPEPSAEWSEALIPRAAARWARANGFEGDGPVNVLGPTDESRRPFIVGSGDEESIQSRLRWAWIGSSAGFVIFGSALLALLLARFGVLG